MDEVNRNRLEEFRQLRQAIRQSEQYLIVGIDVVKDRHHAFFGTATGKTLLRRLVPIIVSQVLLFAIPQIGIL
jgi:hypothetical protein